jgi:hypothetical protein
VSFPQVVIVNPASPIRTIPELIAAARAQPDRITHGSSGQGTTSHLVMALIKGVAGLKMTHAAYRGGAPVLQAVAAGEVQTGVEGIPSLLGQVRGGTLRALAVTSAARSPQLPDVPARLGVPAGLRRVGMDRAAGARRHTRADRGKGLGRNAPRAARARGTRAARGAGRDGGRLDAHRYRGLPAGRVAHVPPAEPVDEDRAQRGQRRRQELGEHRPVRTEPAAHDQGAGRTSPRGRAVESCPPFDGDRTVDLAPHTRRAPVAHDADPRLGQHRCAQRVVQRPAGRGRGRMEARDRVARRRHVGQEAYRDAAARLEEVERIGQRVRDGRRDPLVDRVAGEHAQVLEPALRRVGDARRALAPRAGRGHQTAAHRERVRHRPVRVGQHDRAAERSRAQRDEHAGRARAEHQQIGHVRLALARPHASTRQRSARQPYSHSSAS